MSNKNLSADKDNELQKLAQDYEQARAEGKTLYLDADEYADLADWYATQNNLTQAFDVIERGLNIHPGNDELLIEQAYLYLDTDDCEKAKNIIESLPADDSSAELKVLKANYLLQTGQNEEAIRTIESIDDKDDLANIIDAAYLYLDMGMPQKAMEWLERGKGRYDNKRNYKGTVADCYFENHQYEKAATLYNQLIDDEPYSPSCWYALARCHFEMHQYDKAIEACDYALVSDDDYADAYILKGHAYLYLDNAKTAIECYRKAQQKKHSDSGLIDSYLGLAYAANEDWANGLRYLQLALSENTEEGMSPSVLYINAALCLHKMDRDKEAHQYCKKAFELDPDHVDNLLMASRILLEEGDVKEATLLWDRALKASPTADVWYDIGNMSLEAFNPTYARTAYEHAKELDPDFDDLNEKLTITCLLLHDKENFHKYNRLCKSPMDAESLKRIEEELDKAGHTELSRLIRDFIDMLKQEH